jgi:hypothetical protein
MADDGRLNEGLETKEFFSARRNRADQGASRRILNRQGGETPRLEDERYLEHPANTIGCYGIDH